MEGGGENNKVNVGCRGVGGMGVTIYMYNGLVAHRNWEDCFKVGLWYGRFQVYALAVYIGCVLYRVYLRLGVDKVQHLLGITSGSMNETK